MDFEADDVDTDSTNLLHPEEIRAKLRIKFGTLLAFEKARDLPERSVSDVLRGRSIRRTEIAIADELGVGLHAISRRYAASSANVDDSSARYAAHRINAGAR